MSSSAFVKTSNEICNKYWRNPENLSPTNDLVVIHVCDENRQISRDFCCKRKILVKSMKYFEKFLSESDNGYDDIDISVHCDVEIFEWLMAYIHEPEQHPTLDRSIVVSILISSEFLQMDTLVDTCLASISTCLGDIIRLPIDLSCISDKLINKLAVLTHPKTLAQTKDRKDKILNKLYKRRVELDFSRKSGGKGALRTIAASLTCCRHCGVVYLDSCASLLSCKSSPATIEFRGRLARRHATIPNWSLTAYLKSLHAGGMGWDAIYWHVWAACIIFRVSDIMVSALEVDRYSIEDCGIVINGRACVDNVKSTLNDRKPVGALAFMLDEITADASSGPTYKIKATPYTDESTAFQLSRITPTLNPLRPPEILSEEIFELLCSQTKFVSSATHRALIESIAKAMMKNTGPAQTTGEEGVSGSRSRHRYFDYAGVLWGDTDAAPDGNDERRGRSRSPGRSLKEQGRLAHSLASKRRSSDIGSQDSDLDGAPPVASSGSGGGNGDGAGIAAGGERRSRSSSVGQRRTAGPKRITGGTPSSAKAQTTSSSKMADDKIARQNNDASENDDDNEQPTTGENSFLMIRSLPPEMISRATIGKGATRGCWLTAHPLQLQPNALSDSLSAVAESSLSSDKKIEWQLDLLREFDEKRMDRFEAFLASRRSGSNEEQFRPVSKHCAQKRLGAKYNGDYYRDRARQPYKTSL